MRPRREGGGPAAVHRLREAAPGHGTVHLVHPGALPATVHRTLAAALPEGDGLTVLDLAGLPRYWEAALTGGRAETSIDELADRLLAELPAAGEAPPYTLAGWSFGGVVAQAMVERQAVADRPAALVLLDSIAPVAAYQQPDEALQPSLLLGWFAMYLGAKRGRPVALPADRPAGCDTEQGLLLVLDAAVASGALLPDTPPAGLRKLYDTYVDGLLRNNRLTAGHRPPPSSIPLALVTAERSLLPGDRTLGWDQLAGAGLTIHQVPGDHYTMLTRPDAAALLARLLRPAGHR
ncbi:thioesterase domain-containing protein [Kitasatospora sp. NBC_01287]|uniref:thioesterase domain-containing protein n=1 Tax=Kitasatospora sp. NBC_01287 TaxID=2903573 RepID=UPI002258EF47|nr:thioesterase domain-containing protein [Kitasatospora sp. NBC_01287]MCX4748421.1 thioesterase domain-containing protein [Kitasatospora sp. NBC_01287]